MSSNGGLEKGPRVLYHWSGLGLGCTLSEMVGRRGRFSGVALCAECRDLVGGVGG
jgi:hypothetical protein